MTTRPATGDQSQGNAPTWLRLVPWWWFYLFGIWPLSHPSHTTFGNPVTWIDWTLHALGATAVLPSFLRWCWKEARRVG